MPIFISHTPPHPPSAAAAKPPVIPISTTFSPIPSEGSTSPPNDLHDLFDQSPVSEDLARERPQNPHNPHNPTPPISPDDSDIAFT